MADVFISYGHADEQFVLKLAHDLRSAGVGIWLDQLDIRPSEIWERAIEEAMACCSRLLVILSPISVKSNNVMAECNFALEEGKAIIPVLYRECKIPYRLRLFQRVDFTGDYKRGITELLRVLNTGSKMILDQREPIVPAPTAAEPPLGQEIRPKQHLEELSMASVDQRLQTYKRDQHDARADIIRSALKQPKWNGKIHVDPQIPETMLANARKSFKVGKEQTIVGLIDTTVFGSAREAILFSMQGIYFQSHGSPCFLSYADLKNITFKSSIAPLFTKYISLISFESSGGPQEIGIAGGPF